MFPGSLFLPFQHLFFGSQTPLSNSDKFGSTFQSVLIILSDFSQVSERWLSASRPGNVLCWEYPRRNAEYSWVFPRNPAHGLWWRLSMLTGKEYTVGQSSLLPELFHRHLWQKTKWCVSRWLLTSHWQDPISLVLFWGRPHFPALKFC